MVLGALFGAIRTLAPTILKAIPQISGAISSLAPQTPVQRAEQLVANQTASQGGLSKGQLLALGVGGVAAGAFAFTQRRQIAAGVRRGVRRVRRGRRGGRRSF